MIKINFYIEKHNEKCCKLKKPYINHISHILIRDIFQY